MRTYLSFFSNQWLVSREAKAAQLLVSFKPVAIIGKFVSGAVFEIVVPLQRVSCIIKVAEVESRTFVSA